MNIKPLGLRILTQPIAAETKTASGLIIPDSAQEKQQRAKVIAISKEMENEENNELKVGDTVIYGKFSGTELRIDAMDYLILKKEDVLAII